MGQLGEASKFIETTLVEVLDRNPGLSGPTSSLYCSTSPVLRDFQLARLIGLGNVSERVKKIILRMRKPVDDLIDKIIAFIKSKLKGFKKGKKGKGKKDSKLDKKDEKDAKDLKKKRNQGKDKKDMLPKDGEIGDVVYFKNKTHRHRLWIKVVNGSIKVIVNSNEKEVIQRLNMWSGQLSKLSDEDQAKARGLLSKAGGHLKSVEQYASETYKALVATTKDKNAKTSSAKADKADAKTEEKEDDLGTVLWGLFNLFELEGGLSKEEMAILCRRVAHDIMSDKDVVAAKNKMMEEWEEKTKGKPMKDRADIQIGGDHKPAALGAFLRDDDRSVKKGTKETFQYEGEDKFKRKQGRGAQGTNALILTGKKEEALHYLKTGYISKLKAMGTDQATATAAIAYMKERSLTPEMEPHKPVFASMIGLMFGQEVQRSAVALVNASQVMQLVAKGRISWRSAFEKYFSMARDKAAKTARKTTNVLNEGIKKDKLPMERGSQITLGSKKAANQMIQDESDAANMWFETRVATIVTKMQTEGKEKFKTKAEATEYLRKFMKKDLMNFMKTQ